MTTIQKSISFPSLEDYASSFYDLIFNGTDPEIKRRFRNIIRLSKKFNQIPPVEEIYEKVKHGVLFLDYQNNYLPDEAVSEKISRRTQMTLKDYYKSLQKRKDREMNETQRYNFIISHLTHGSNKKEIKDSYYLQTEKTLSDYFIFKAVDKYNSEHPENPIDMNSIINVNMRRDPKTLEHLKKVKDEDLKSVKALKKRVEQLKIENERLRNEVKELKERLNQE